MLKKLTQQPKLIWIGAGILAGLIVIIVLFLGVFNGASSQNRTAADVTGSGALALATTSAAGGEEYLALGDSVAFGVGASSPQELGYATVFYQQYLKQARPNMVAYKNLALAGETTGSFISRPKSKSQLEKAIEELDAAPKAGHPVSLITLTIGANDLLAARNKSQTEKLAVLEQTDTNLQNILSQLIQHSSNGKTSIIITTYYNPYPAGSPNAAEDGSWLERFNEIVKKRAGDLNLKVADFFEPVVGKEKSLTWIASGDIHPNTAGHAALALAVWKATSYTTASRENELQNFLA